MTLDEAIAHVLEVAEQNETQADKIGRQLIGSAIDKYATDCRECAAEHRRLAEWLTELKDLREENKVLTSECDRLITEKAELLKQHEQIAEYKRLLKAAVEDLNSIYRVLEDNDILCVKYIACKGCPFNGKNCDKWRYANEALKLINS